MLPPFVIITPIYILGLLIATYLQKIELHHIIILFLLFILLTIYSYLKNLKWTNYFILINFLLLGVFIYQFNNLPLPSNHIYYEDIKNLKIIGYVTDEPKIKKHKKFISQKCIVKVERIINENKINKKIGKVIVFFKKWNPAATLPHLSYGDKVILTGRLDTPPEQSNPYSFSYKDYLKRYDIYNIFYAEKIEILNKEKKYDPIKKYAIDLKNRYLQVFNQTISYPYNQLLGSLIFGERASPIPKYLEEQFRATGVVHILVASGAQVGMLLGLCLLLMRTNIKDNKFYSILTAIITIFLIIFYAHMAGAQLSIIRASIMGVVFVISIILYREYDARNSLSLAAFLMLLAEPDFIYDTGLQLSFAACIGIVYITPKLINLLKVFKIENFERLSYFIISIVAVCISAQVMVLPLIGYYFNNFSAVAFISNIFIVPLVGILLPFGLFTGLVGIVSLPIAYVLNSFCEFLLFIMVKLNYLFYIIPYSCNQVKSPEIYLIIIYYLVIFFATNYEYLEKFKIRKEKLVITLLAIFTVIIFIELRPYFNNNLTVTFFDVGEGDCILIKKNNIYMVIDGGLQPEEYKTPLENYLIKEGIKRIKYVVLTHPHHDHIEGLIPILQNFKVDYVIAPIWDDKDEVYDKFEELITKRNITRVEPISGDRIRLTNDVYFDILNPQEEFLTGTSSDIDNNSVVLRLVHNNISLLFTGDIFYEAEQVLLNSNLRSDILKVAHHGSNTSSTLEFLSKVSPKIAIISSGRRSQYHHPHPDIIKRLKELNTEIYCTADNGAIIINSDGEKYNVETMIK